MILRIVVGWTCYKFIVQVMTIVSLGLTSVAGAEKFASAKRFPEDEASNNPLEFNV
jgi:hypothetical protein